MKRSDKIKKKINDTLYDHFVLRQSLNYIWTGLLCVLSGAIFAFGFACFITPVEGDLAIVTGGVSGISQNIYLIISFFFPSIKLSDVTSIAYFAINVPIIVFAFFKIGPKFAIFSLINVTVTSVLIRFFPPLLSSLQDLMKSSEKFGGIISRVLFGGLCTGLSSAIAFRANISCGGMDVFSYYFSLRKSSSVGKYTIMINMVIVVLYTILSIVKTPNEWAKCLLIALFAFLYQFICSLIIDLINVRNKKVQLQIITNNEHMPKVLLANIPHSGTLLNGKGAYSHQDKIVIYMVVSSLEVNKVVNLCKRVDEHVFIAVTPLNQVFGNFFIKPVE